MRGKVDRMNKMDDQELISALADGQLQGEAFARGVQAAAAASGREAWCAYHVVGEVLRTGRAHACTPPEVFLARLQRRLQAEQLVLQPAAARAVVRPVRASANDTLWKLAAGVASFAAVAAVGWNLWGAGAPANPQPQVAAAAASAPVAVASAATTRDARLDMLLAAHRQFAGSTALGTSGFLRNATFEGPSR